MSQTTAAIDTLDAMLRTAHDFVANQNPKNYDSDAERAEEAFVAGASYAMETAAGTLGGLIRTNAAHADTAATDPQPVAADSMLTVDSVMALAMTVRTETVDQVIGKITAQINGLSVREHVKNELRSAIKRVSAEIR